MLKKTKRAVRKVMNALRIYEPIYRVYAGVKQGKRQKAAVAAFEELLQEIRAAAASCDPARKRMVLTGILDTPKKPKLFPLFEQISAELPEVDFIYLDEQKKPQGERKPFFHYIPRAIRAAGYDSFTEFELTHEMTDALEADPFLEQCAEYLFQRQGKSMTQSYARFMVWSYDRLYRTVIDCYKPEAIIIWCKFPMLHQVCNHVCLQKGVTPLFIEFGSLPGTYALDPEGQMGESPTARNYEHFRTLPVTDEEIAQAEKVIEFLRASALNRNAANASTVELDELKTKLDPSKPIVMLAGQSDFDSGILPYDETAKANHSPMFADSAEAALHLAEVAEKMGFNFIFKPHPAMVAAMRKRKWPENLHLVTNTDINKIIDLSDLVVSIVSQTGYMSTIRGKATLTLGYNQLRGKGATYEAYTLEAIPGAITAALQDGQTEEMKQHFIRHAAQMLRYNLYDDLGDRPLRFGQKAAGAAEFLRGYIKQ